MAGENVGGISAGLTLEDGQFKAAVAQDTAATDKLSGGLMRLSKSSARADKGMGSLAKGMQTMAGAAVAGGLALGGFNLAEASAGNATAAKSFEKTGGNIDRLRQSVSGMISDAELMKKRNLADTMGINEDTFARLAVVAQGASAKTGQAFGHMFDSIITGTARGSKMILDNLGIIISQEEANKRWAAANKTVVGSMSDLQKKTAFTTETLRIGEAMMKDLGLSAADLVDPFAQMRAAIANIADDVGAFLVPAFTKLVGIMMTAMRGIDMLRNAFDNLPAGAKEVISTIGAIALGLTAAVGAAGALASAFIFLQPAFVAIGAAITAAALPLMQFVIIAAGAAAVAGALRKAWEMNLGGIQEKFMAFRNTATDVFNWLKSLMADAGNFLADGFDKVWDGIVDGATIVPQAIGLIIEKITSKVLDLVLFVEKTINSIAGSGIGKQLGLEGVDFSSAKTAAKGLATSGAVFNQEIKNAVDLLKEFTNPRKLVATAISGSGDTLATVGDGLVTAGKFVGEGWSLIFDDMMKGLKGFGVDFEKKVEKGIVIKKPPGDNKPLGAPSFSKSGGGTAAKFIAAGIAPPGMADESPIASSQGGFSKAIQMGRGLADAFGSVTGAVGGFINSIKDAITTITGDSRIADALISGVGAMMMSVMTLGIGGPLAAFGGAFLILARETESFAALQKGIASSFDRLIGALEPFADKFFALVGLFDAFIGVAIVLADAFVNVDFVARGLFEVMKGIAIQGVGVILALANFQNMLLEGAFIWLRIASDIASMFGVATPELAALRAGLLGMRIDTDKLGKAFVDLATLSFEEADERGRGLSLQEEQNEQLEQTNNINVPELFKVEEERFKAIQEGLGSSTAALGLEQGTADGGTVSNFYGNITIQLTGISDAEQAAAAIEATLNRRAAEQTGNPNGRGNRNGGGL